MGYSGSKRVHVNDFTLTLDDAPPGQFAHFFYGSEAIQAPFADGFRCVNADIMRLVPAGMIDSQGHLERSLDLAPQAG